MARRIACHNLSIEQAESDQRIDSNWLPEDVKEAYKACWSFQDDVFVESDQPDSNAVVMMQFGRIERYRGKGSVAKRRRFLQDDPLAKRFLRKMRYPFDEVAEANDD